MGSKSNKVYIMDRVLVLRTCDENMRSFGGFQWPESGNVSAPDWDPKPECGNGLHGLLWGEGDGSLLYGRAASKWLVCSVDPERIVDLDGKVKFPECEVVHAGDMASATTYIYENGGQDRAIYGLVINLGADAECKAGDRSYVTVSHNSKVSAGMWARIIGGLNCTLTGGKFANIAGRSWSTISGGDFSYLTGGLGSTLIAGECSSFSGGVGSTFISLRSYGVSGERRSSTAYVDGVEYLPNTKYMCVNGHWSKV